MSIAPTVSSTLSLNELPLARQATIAGVDAPPFESLRLMGLGLCEGRRVQLIKRGDPLILQVMGVRVGLAAQLGKLVRIVLND